MWVNYSLTPYRSCATVDREEEEYDDEENDETRGKGVGAFFTMVCARMEVRSALYTVQPPFLVGGFLWRFLLLFRSNANFRLYYSIQKTPSLHKQHYRAV